MDLGLARERLDPGWASAMWTMKNALNEQLAELRRRDT